MFVLYVLLELALAIVLVNTIGLGWTLLLVVSTFALGLVLAGSQARRQIRKLQDGLTTPQGALTDGGLVALGSVLVVLPGLLTTAAGLLLLLPPTRAVVRPAIAAAATRSFAKRAPLIGVVPGSFTRPNPHGDYIDGEVIDVVDLDQPSITRKPE